MEDLNRAIADWREQERSRARQWAEWLTAQAEVVRRIGKPVRAKSGWIYHADGHRSCNLEDHKVALDHADAELCERHYEAQRGNGSASRVALAVVREKLVELVGPDVAEALRMV